MHKKEQHAEYRVLLDEKTTRDMELSTYRSGH